MRNLKKQIQKEAQEVSEALFNLRSKFRFPKFRNVSMKIALVLLLVFLHIPGTDSLSETGAASAMNSYKMSPETIYINTVRDKFQEKLVTEVETYITEIAPESQLSPEFLVKKCLEYETDIIFVLSQALLESHFGTKGKAAKTNSVWNVGTYDNGKILYRYKTADESLEPYLKLIKEKYLITVTNRGDTIYKDLGHLIQDKGYVNYDGRRFASARGYENGMRKLMVKMDMETSISFYQKILTLSDNDILAFFAPPEELELDYSMLQAFNIP